MSSAQTRNPKGINKAKVSQIIELEERKEKTYAKLKMLTLHSAAYFPLKCYNLTDKFMTERQVK